MPWPCGRAVGFLRRQVLLDLLHHLRGRLHPVPEGPAGQRTACGRDARAPAGARHALAGVQGQVLLGQQGQQPRVVQGPRRVQGHAPLHLHGRAAPGGRSARGRTPGPSARAGRSSPACQNCSPAWRKRPAQWSKRGTAGRAVATKARLRGLCRLGVFVSRVGAGVYFL